MFKKNKHACKFIHEIPQLKFTIKATKVKALNITQLKLFVVGLSFIVDSR